MNLLEGIIELYSRGNSTRDIAALPGMPSQTTVSRMLKSCPEGRAILRPKEHKKRMADKSILPKVEGGGHAYDGFEGTLEERVHQLELENDILRGMVEVLKGVSLGQASNREKSLLIEWLRQETSHPLRELTAFLKISKSSYEYWRAHLHDAGIRDEIAGDVERIFHEDGCDARGYRFVHEVLKRQLGHPISEKIVRDVMRERRLIVIYKKKSKSYSSYAGEPDKGAPNLPYDARTGKHDFHADSPNEKWVTDITEFKLPDDKGKVYLSPVIDLYDGKPIGWSISKHPDSKLAESSLKLACGHLREGEHPICHSDRGIHYRTASWKAICEANGVIRSMSRKGCSPDNAACEGFFGRLKNEFFHGRDWKGVTAEEFMEALDGWMRFYSKGRLKAFRENGKVVYDTIDSRRARLGWVA